MGLTIMGFYKSGGQFGNEFVVVTGKYMKKKKKKSMIN